MSIQLMTIVSAVLLAVYITAILAVIFWPTRQHHPEDGQAVGCLMMVVAALAGLGIALALGAWFHAGVVVKVIFAITVFPTVILVPQLVRLGIQKYKQKSIAKGTKVPADQLIQKLSGQTHVTRCGSVEPPRQWNELRYYSPDGRVIQYEEEAGQIKLVPGDIRWSIKDGIFETLNDIQPGNKNRYTLWETPDGHIAYHIYVPRSRLNGKLSRKTAAIHSGEPVVGEQHLNDKKGTI